MENMVDPVFWAGKTVLVTGHTGFKGSWLSLWLQSLRSKVIGYALPPPTNPSLFEVANVANGLTSITADLRDFSPLLEVMRQYQPEIIIHMAAQSLVRHSYINPIETYSTNVMGTVHVLEAARQTGSVKVLINVTSDKCYENQEWHWGYRENEKLGGFDPYSNSKACAELVTAAYRNSYFSAAEHAPHGIALASARAGNVIGGGDWAEDRLIPDIMRAILNGKPVLLRHPHAVRPWQHVLEPLGGYLLLAQELWKHGPLFAEAWNFGPDEQDAKPVSWIAGRLTEMWGTDTTWLLDSVKQMHEAHYLKLDCSKAKARLGWQPKWNLSQALEAIVAWYRAYQAQENMRDIMLKQITIFT